MLSSPRTLLRGVAAIGGVLTLAFFVGGRISTPAFALMLGANTIVPIGLAIAGRGHEGWGSFRRATYLSAAAAGAAMVGWFEPVGSPLAIGAALVHLAATLAVLAFAVARLRDRATRWGIRRLLDAPEELSIDVGLGLLSVGGVWLFASRAGFGLLGFVEPTVTFTAAHFHFAGFGAPVVVGALGRSLAGARPRSYRLAATVVCAGIPLTAVGIATTARLERIAAVMLASGMLVASVLLIFVAAPRAWRRGDLRSRLAGLLLVGAGTSLVGTMSLATAFALSSSAGRGSTLAGIVPLQTMIDLHGGGNALGFAASALLAFHLLDDPAMEVRSVTPRR